MLRSFRQLPPYERVVVVQALLLTLAMISAIRLVPFARVAALVMSGSARPGRPRLPSKPIGRWVAAVGRRVPGASCLVQALVACWLLRRHGHEAELRFGVARPVGSRLEAHAWVESEGAVVLGASRTRYVTLLGTGRTA